MQPLFLDVTVNGKSLGLPSSIYNTPGIVDSGTPFATIPTAAFAALRSLLAANCTRNPLVGLCGAPANATVFDGACFAMTAAQRALWPLFSFHLAGAHSDDVVVSLEPHLYLSSGVCGDASQVGLALVPDPQFTVIGGNAFLKYAAVYDKELMQVGFSDATAVPCT